MENTGGCLSAFVDEGSVESHRMFLARRTALEMLRDRGYAVDPAQLDLTLPTFRAAYGEHPDLDRLRISSSLLSNPAKKVLVIFCGTETFKLSAARAIFNQVNKENLSRLILILQSKMTSQARAHMKEINIFKVEHFQITELLVNITKHILKPKHAILTAKEKQKLLKKYNVQDSQASFVVCTLDHQGHGFSEGLVAHIPNIEPVIDDCIAFFDSFRVRHPPSLPCFMYAESLAGAKALLIHLRDRGSWDGLVLNGAMCGISTKFKPPWPREHLLSFVAALVPTWQVVPTHGSLPEVSFKAEWKRRLALANPRRTVARPHAATTLELFCVCREVQCRFEEVTLPLLIMHGGDDVVCDPVGVKELYRQAASEDKTLRIYPGMWHQIVEEPTTAFSSCPTVAGSFFEDTSLRPAN